MSFDDPVIKGETEVRIQKDDESRDDNHQNDDHNRHFLLEIHASS